MQPVAFDLEIDNYIASATSVYIAQLSNFVTVGYHRRQFN
jgi:hypothetical protein